MEDEDVARDDPPLRSDEATVPSSPTPQDVIARMAEMEVDADAHEAAIDAELRASPPPPRARSTPSSRRRRSRSRPRGAGPSRRARAPREPPPSSAAKHPSETSEDERAVAAALAHYDGAKRALAELSARMERVQRTIDELEDDAAVAIGEMETPGEPDPGAPCVAAPAPTRLEREAAEYARRLRRERRNSSASTRRWRARRELIDAEHDVVFVDDLRTAVAKREADRRSFATRLASRTSRGQTRRRCVGTRRRGTRRTRRNGRGGRWWRSGSGS